MRILLTEERLREGIDRLATEIQGFYGDQPLTIVGVLTGSIMVVADLIRRLHMPLRVGLVQASSYRHTVDPGELELNLDILLDIKGSHVLLVDDIFDTGNTLIALMAELCAQEPASLRSAVLLRKRGRQAVDFEPDHVVFEIPNEFVVGYGLDYRDAYRNLPYLGALEEEEIRRPPGGVENPASLSCKLAKP